MRYRKRLGFLIFTVFSLVLFRMPVTAQTQARAYLEGYWDDTGIFILKVMLEPQDISLCGLELDVAYDTDILTLSSCERGDALSDLNFDCSLKSGRVRLLFWGEENSIRGGRLATVCFIFAGADGECEFSLSVPTDTSAIYFENDRIIATDIALSGLKVPIQSASQGGQEAPPTENSGEIETSFPTEPPTEGSTDTSVGTGVPDGLPNSSTDTSVGTDVPGGLQNPPVDTPRRRAGLCAAKNVCLVLACTASGAGMLAAVPLLLPDIFRKGYF